MILRCIAAPRPLALFSLVLAGCGFERVQMVMPSFL
jgi:hypothetical protein